MKDMLDGPGFDVFNPYKSKCSQCKYFSLATYSCPAFPDVIPDKFLSGDSEHASIDPSQKGELVFTSRT